MFHAAIAPTALPVRCQSAVLESRPMKMARHTRSLTAWMLYASVLFSLFACGIHHGQMSALNLSGLGGGFCSVSTDSGAGLELTGSDTQSVHLDQVSCPLCSSFAAAVAVNSSAWPLDYIPARSVAPIVVRSFAQPPPRLNWPSLNPRAPPIA